MHAIMFKTEYMLLICGDAGKQGMLFQKKGKGTINESCFTTKATGSIWNGGGT
jgi:hypothetical protein